jgi:hypothetical protein
VSTRNRHGCDTDETAATEIDSFRHRAFTINKRRSASLVPVRAYLRCGASRPLLPLQASCRPHARRCRRRTSPTSGASER